LPIGFIDEEGFRAAVAQHADMFAWRQAPVERDQDGAQACAGEQEYQKLWMVLAQIGDAIAGRDIQLAFQQAGGGLYFIVEPGIRHFPAFEQNRGLAGLCPRPFFDPVCNVHALTFPMIRHFVARS